ncbi:MAG: hypothetical protein V4482_06675 [Pseudomonadota bacterium]
MIKTFKRLLCAVAVLTTNTWAAEFIAVAPEVLTVNFQQGNFVHASVTAEDKAEFEILREAHNTQHDALVRVPCVADVFDNQIARRNSGNAWHALTVRDAESNEMVAALIFGRLPAIGYNPEDHAGIQAFIRSLNITGEDNARIANRGLATYSLMTNMDRMTAYLTEFHQNAFAHCCRLVDEARPLPIERTIPTHVALLVRSDAPDAEAMAAARYALYEHEGDFNLSEFYPPKATYAWVQAIPQ